MLERDCCDCDQDSCHDGGEGHHGHPADVTETAGEGTEEGEDEAEHTIDDGAGGMRGDGVERDGEGKDVGGHNEEEEDDLGESEELAAERAEEDHAGVGHVVDVWVAGFELPDHVAGVGGEDAEDQDEEEAAGEGVSKVEM